MIELVMSSQMDVGRTESVHSSRDGLRKKEWTDGEAALEEVVGVKHVDMEEEEEEEEKEEEGDGEEEEEAIAETDRTGLVLVERRGRVAGRGV